MTGIINRVPVGLLDLLDMKSRGQTPRELSSWTQAVVDIAPLYFSDLERAVASVDAGVNAIGLTTSLAVPQDEIWLVREMSVSTSTGAGEAITFAPWLFTTLNRPGGGFYSGAVGLPNTLAASSTGAAFANKPLWAQAGDRLGFIVQSITGTVDFATRALVIPFKR